MCRERHSTAASTTLTDAIARQVPHPATLLATRIAPTSEPTAIADRRDQSLGANPWMLAVVLGHTGTHTINRVYEHLSDRDREQLQRRINDSAHGATGNGEVISRPAT